MAKSMVKWGPIFHVIVLSNSGSWRWRAEASKRNLKVGPEDSFLGEVLFLAALCLLVEGEQSKRVCCGSCLQSRPREPSLG